MSRGWDRSRGRDTRSFSWGRDRSLGKSQGRDGTGAGTEAGVGVRAGVRTPEKEPWWGQERSWAEASGGGGGAPAREL